MKGSGGPQFNKTLWEAHGWWESNEWWDWAAHMPVRVDYRE